MSNEKIKVLVVDDSKVLRLLLVHLLESDPQIEVIGAVDDGQMAVDFVSRSKPNVIVMDIHMPNLDGFEATRLIMETNPVPIIICTGTTNPADVLTTFRLMEAGAVACVEKPVAREHSDFEELAANFLQTVKLMSEIRVVRRWARLRPTSLASPGGSPAEAKPPPDVCRIIGIGASTGGPPVLQTILSGLPKDFPASILIVQHIASGFLSGLVEWLNQTTGFHVHVGSHMTSPLPGHAYLAPDDFHMGISPGERIILARKEPENSLRPAVSFLFRTLAETCGQNAIGVLLTGMGRDGATELKLMKDQGAFTIAQDKETSIVHGMPGAAIELGGATHILPADQIAGALIALMNRKLANKGIKS